MNYYKRERRNKKIIKATTIALMLLIVEYAIAVFINWDYRFDISAWSGDSRAVVVFILVGQLFLIGMTL